MQVEPAWLCLRSGMSICWRLLLILWNACALITVALVFRNTEGVPFAIAVSAVALVVTLYTLNCGLRLPRLALAVAILFPLALFLQVLVANLIWIPTLATTDVETDAETYLLLTAAPTFDFSSLNYPGGVLAYRQLADLGLFSPVSITVLNAALALLTVLSVASVYSRLGSPRLQATLAVILLVPSLVWFNAMPSKEALVIPLVACAIALFAQMVSCESVLRSASCGIGLGATLTGLLLIRGAVLIPLMVIFAALFVATYPASGFPSWKWPPLIGIFCAFTLFMAGIVATRQASSSLPSVATVLENSSTSQNWVNGVEQPWSERSVGQALDQSSLISRVAAFPAKLLANLLIPITDIANVGGIPAIHQWALITGILTTVLIMCLIPFSVGGLVWVVSSWQVRRPFLAIHAPFWILIGAVAVGTPILQDRYRLMALPWLIGSAASAAGALQGRWVKRATLSWLAVLALAAAGYGAIKIGLISIS